MGLTVQVDGGGQMIENTHVLEMDGCGVIRKRKRKRVLRATLGLISRNDMGTFYFGMNLLNKSQR